MKSIRNDPWFSIGVPHFDIHVKLRYDKITRNSLGLQDVGFELENSLKLYDLDFAAR